MTKEAIEEIPNFDVFLSSLESVQSAKRALQRNNTHTILVKEGKDIVGYVTAATLLDAHPHRLLADVPIEEIKLAPSSYPQDLFQIMHEQDIPLVGVKDNGHTPFFLEREDVND